MDHYFVIISQLTIGKFTMKNKPDFNDYLWATFFAIVIGAMLGFIFAIKNGGF
jgi:hypothetical protein